MSGIVTTQDWEAEIGAQIRRARILDNLTQAELAGKANVSLPTVSKLEAGKGSTVSTLVRVARALGKEDWLSSFEPADSFDPFDVWRQSRRAKPRQRVRKAE